MVNALLPSTLTLTLTLPAAMMAKDAAYLLLESEESANYKGRRQPPTVVEKDGGCQSAVAVERVKWVMRGSVVPEHTYIHIVPNTRT